MEFGKVQYIENIDLSLPADDPVTSHLWQRISRTAEGSLRIFIGGTEWGRASWVGSVYPARTKPKAFLAAYARQFNTVELNALFYGLQPPSVIQRWASAVGEGFRFCPKFSETISHKLQLAGAGKDTGEFIGRVGDLGDKLGPSFLQLPERFGPDKARVLEDYLRTIPADFRMAVELRHEGWFNEAGAALGATWQLFRELGVGTVITDVAGRRDVLHMRLTAPFAFIRFVTNGLHPSDYVRADAWVQRIRSWAEKGLREVYLFVHSPEELTSPEMMAYLIGRLNETCGTGLHMPQLAGGGQAGDLTLF